MQIMTLISCIQDYGRGALDGIARYANLHGQWKLSLNHEAQARQRLPKIDPEIRGIIAHAHRPGFQDALEATGLPVVNTSGLAPRPSMCNVVTDDDAIGRMAAEDLVGRGHRNLLVFAVRPWQHATARMLAFVDAAKAANVSPTVRVISRWSRVAEEINQELQKAPTPIAVFAPADSLAVNVVRQCHDLNLAMPEQVAVLGVDNDTLTSRMMSPSISSIEVPWEKLGFTAAALLHGLIRGEPAPTEPTLIAPSRVVARQTTDNVAIEDPDVATVVRYIREHFHEPFTIDDVLRRVPVSRRALEQRFKAAIGRTLHTHITTVRLERAKSLLADTDYAMPEVARHCGFSEANYFSTVFKRHTGQSPTTFRSAYRLV